MTFLVASSLFLAAISSRFNIQGAGPVLPAAATQMILVIAPNWDDLHTRIYLCDKKQGKWHIQANFPAVCGKKGMAWGIGIFPENTRNLTPVKKEGDLKSPAGLFQLGECMGYAPKLEYNTNLQYRRLTETVQGVDDPQSKFYNRIVDTKSFQDTSQIDWKSFEKMKRADDYYKWLFVINHNPANLPGAGSLIFLHLWKNENSGTAGCTAVGEPTMIEILKWLNTQNPILVQLPHELYLKYRKDWDLPTVN